MTKFHDLSIKRQLMTIISMVSGIVLLLACAALARIDHSLAENGERKVQLR